MRVLLTADTHGPKHLVPTWLLGAVATADLVLHAGDVCDQGTLRALGTKPVYAVRGNRDEGLVLPERLLISCGGVQIGVVHGHLGPGGDTEERALRSFAPRPDVIVFGHSHRHFLERREGVWLANPGSPTRPKDAIAAALLLDILDGALTWRKIGPLQG